MKKLRQNQFPKKQKTKNSDFWDNLSSEEITFMNQQIEKGRVTVTKDNIMKLIKEADSPKKKGKHQFQINNRKKRMINNQMYYQCPNW